jgi:hypothetical protein
MTQKLRLPRTFKTRDEAGHTDFIPQIIVVSFAYACDAVGRRV